MILIDCGIAALLGVQSHNLPGGCVALQEKAPGR
jgi:hypothetical protein